MGLKEYRKKRDFEKTPEPSGHGTQARHKRLSFCIQKHAASHLHYDFRLELDGVLKSWSVPKGPSLDPANRRLAVHVEDHPINYGGFEGLIPQGEYGGGTVLLWDRGTWEALGDPEEMYRKGRLKFELHGNKLHGIWALVRMWGRESGGKQNWLLIKDDDDEARRGDAGAITELRPESVKTRRTIEEIAARSRSTWHSNRVEATKPEPAARKKPAARKAPARKKTTAPRKATARKKTPVRKTTRTAHKKAA